MLYLIIFFSSFFNHVKNDNSKPLAAFYVISEVKVKCISQCDAVGSDQVYASMMSTCCTSKTTVAKSFGPGVLKSYTEIGANSGSTVTMWCMNLGDKLSFYEKDLVDPDDLILQVSLSTINATGAVKTFTGTNGRGKYEISFKATKVLA